MLYCFFIFFLRTSCLLCIPLQRDVKDPNWIGKVVGFDYKAKFVDCDVRRAFGRVKDYLMLRRR